MQPQLDAIAALDIGAGSRATDRAAAACLWPVASCLQAGSTQDPDNSEQQYCAMLDQGGLGFPDRDYYTKDDAKSKEIREKISAACAESIQLARRQAGSRKRRMPQTVMRMETALAKAPGRGWSGAIRTN